MEACLNSIRDQQLANWELVMIDDHSSDESMELMAHYAAKDSRITFERNLGNGIIPALQQAFSQTQGTYITRMDSDDIMPATRLKKMVNAIEKAPKQTIVTGLVNYFSETEVSPGYQTYELWLNDINLHNSQWPNIYRECVIASPNWMASKDELERISAFDNLYYPEDYHLVLKWYQHQFHVLTIPDITLHWREHSQRTSRNSAHYNQKAFFDLKIRAFIQHDLHTQHLVLWGKNPKTSLTAKVLDQHQIPYHQFNQSSFKEIESMTNPQLLIGVYPSIKERKQIETYLNGLGLTQGKNWWYL